MKEFIHQPMLYLTFAIVLGSFFSSTILNSVGAQSNVLQFLDKSLSMKKPNIVTSDVDKVNTGNNTMGRYSCGDPGEICECTGGSGSSDCAKIKSDCVDDLQCKSDGTCICVRAP